MRHCEKRDKTWSINYHHLKQNIFIFAHKLYANLLQVSCFFFSEKEIIEYRYLQESLFGQVEGVVKSGCLFS